MRTHLISLPPGLSEALERVAEIRARCAALAGPGAGNSPGLGVSGLNDIGVSGVQSRNSVACAVSALKRRNTSFPSLAAVSTSTDDIRAAIASAAARHGLDPAVLTALAHVESGFRTDAVSPDGALGIAQLMPQTARELGVADPLDLRAGLEGGAKYLEEQLGRFSGDLSLALAAYNAGPAAVARYGGIPPYPETQRFVSRVLDLTRRYAAQAR